MARSDGGDSRELLLRRVRCVAFAALSADATEEEVTEAVRVAFEADRRRRAARPRLEVVR